ncbi:hypothetical protein COOONC_05584, partial [Cooperia oncophora]
QESTEQWETSQAEVLLYNASLKLSSANTQKRIRRKSHKREQISKRPCTTITQHPATEVGSPTIRWIHSTRNEVPTAKVHLKSMLSGRAKDLVAFVQKPTSYILATWIDSINDDEYVQNFLEGQVKSWRNGKKERQLDYRRTT